MPASTSWHRRLRPTRPPAVAWQAEHVVGRSARGRRALAAGASAALLALAGASALQVGHWRDAVSLHEQAVRVTHDNFMEHHRLARALLERDRVVEAEYHFRRSAEIEPRRADPSVGLGDALLRQGRVEEAVRAYRSALESEPLHRDAPIHLGTALVRAGRPQEALDALRGSLARSGDDPALQLALARAHAALGHPRASIRHYREALRLQPELAVAATELAWILATSPEASVRDPDEAIRLAEAALAAEPPRAAGLDALAAAYAAAGRFDAAAAKAREAARLAARGDPALAAAAQARSELYRGGRPYVAAGGDRLR
jgi:tetratricopeptide (TPR) repeat protein